MLEVTVFTLDLEFVSHLCRARARGCEVKVLLDLQQCLEPSCTHHAAALKALRIGNVAMRCPRFDAGGIDALHLKQWVFDGGLLLVGSMNASKNSVTKCLEAGIFSRYGHDVAIARKQFNDLWGEGSNVPFAAFSAVSINEGRRSRSASISAARRGRWDG